MNMKDYGRSLIRTIVPLIVGSVVAWLASQNIDVDAGTLVPAVDAVVAGLYYAIVRGLEQKFPAAGWMLGHPGAPQYAHPGTPGIVVAGSSDASS
jgi:hypothetical protein